jgi:hypothetical protein
MDDFHHDQAASPIALAVLGISALMILGGSIWAFVLALKSGKLSTAGMVCFGLVLACGCGILPALALGFTAVQRGAFASVEAGGDPIAARTPQTHYKIAAGIVIAGVLVGLFAR